MRWTDYSALAFSERHESFTFRSSLDAQSRRIRQVAPNIDAGTCCRLAAVAVATARYLLVGEFENRAPAIRWIERVEFAISSRFVRSNSVAADRGRKFVRNESEHGGIERSRDRARRHRGRRRRAPRDRRLESNVLDGERDRSGIRSRSR